ncbi:hypothetical protein GCM10018954_072120 [Kutzneria kofuensis]
MPRVMKPLGPLRAVALAAVRGVVALPAAVDDELGVPGGGPEQVVGGQSAAAAVADARHDDGQRAVGVVWA